jgi:hypothetical protein
MIQTEVPVVVSDPGLSGMASLSNVELTTLARDHVNIWCFQAKVILDGQKEIGDLSKWEAYSFDVVLLACC